MGKVVQYFTVEADEDFCHHCKKGNHHMVIAYGDESIFHGISEELATAICRELNETWDFAYTYAIDDIEVEYQKAPGKTIEELIKTISNQHKERNKNNEIR